MKWLVAMAAVAGLLWLGAGGFSDWIDMGRDSAGGWTEPIEGLSETLEQTRSRAADTHRKIGVLTGKADLAVGLSPSGDAAVYGSEARRDLGALGR